MSAEARAGTPTWLKVLFGCGVMAGLMALVVFVLVGYGVYWLTSPGRQVPTALAVGPDSAGEIRMGDLGADPGVKAFFVAFVDATQKAAKARGRPEARPPFADWIFEMQRAQAGNALTQWLPSEATVSLEPRGPDGDLGVVAAVNFRGYVRPIRAFLERTSREDRTVTTRRHGESTILSAKDGMGLCFAEGTVLVSDDAESLDAVLDRAARPPASSPPATRSREMTDLASRFDVYGVMTRPASATLALHVLLGMDDHSLAEPPPGVEELTGARFGIDIVSGDLAQGLLELTYAREEAAAAAARALEGGLSEKADRLAEDGLGLRWTTQVAGPKLTLDLRFEGLTHALEKSMSEPRGRGRAP